MKKTNKIWYLAFSLIFLLQAFSFVSAQETEGCCVYLEAETNEVSGCIDRITKGQCGGDEGVIGDQNVQWKSQEECRDISGCLVDVEENPIILSIPILGQAKVSDIGYYADLVYRWSIGAISILAVVMIMIAGFSWINAFGNESKISKAKERIRRAVFGLLLIAGAYLILEFINPQTVNLDQLSITKVVSPPLGDNRGDMVCNSDEYPNVYCGEVIITDEESGETCMGAKCSSRSSVCLLEIDSEGKIALGQQGCTSTVRLNDFNESGLTMAQTAGGNTSVRVDTSKCGKWKYGDSEVMNRLQGLAGTVASIIGTGAGSVFGPVGSMAGSLGSSTAANDFVESLSRDTLYIGDDCSLGGGDESVCYLIKSQGGKYIMDDNMSSHKIPSACCADDEGCLSDLADSISATSAYVGIATCEGRYDYGLDDRGICGSYYYDEAVGCKIGTRCIGADDNKMCNLPSDESSLPVCVEPVIGYNLSSSMTCGDVDDVTRRVGTSCSEGTCVLVDGSYTCI